MLTESIFNGKWLYRSLLNTPTLVDDFNKVKWGECIVTLNEYSPGLISGNFDFGDNYVLDTIGSVNESSVRLYSTGRKGTSTDGWLYEHQGKLAPGWDSSDAQRPALVGSVIRSHSHDGHPAGVVGSFIAVAIDRPTTGIDPLPDSVIAVLGNVMMRLHHSAWHATRNSWGQLNLPTRDAITALNWAPPRPSLEYNDIGEMKRAITWSGAGEDFLFMHRQMVIAFKKAMQGAGNQWQSWVTIPPPGSGPTVPPAWFNGDVSDSTRFAVLKTDDFYWSRMRWWDKKFKDPSYLRTISLGELGSSIEWSVHNDMHMRWSSIPRDPITHEPIASGRNQDDFDNKWALPSSNDLADFYSSHVHPIFWKLHGWIDDRINDWFEAHELYEPGSIQRIEMDGTPWFKKGKWVDVEMPWVGPMHHHMQDRLNYSPASPATQTPSDDPIEVMKQVIRLVTHPIQKPGFVAPATRVPNFSRVNAFV